MRATIYGWLNTTAIKALIGDPPRAAPAGAEEHEGEKPYITWQIVSGTAQNYLAEAPDMDDYRIQFDLYAKTDAGSWQLLRALREALEPHGHEVSFNLDLRDPETQLYRKSVDFEFWLPRD